jgi:hypothetical protein
VTKLRETRGGLLPGGRRVVAEQGRAEDFPVFRLGRTSTLGGPDAQEANDVVFEVADGQGRHDFGRSDAVKRSNDSI